jgi:hypothetical protein
MLRIDFDATGFRRETSALAGNLAMPRQFSELAAAHDIGA